jgi:hypothetical protein
MEIIPLKYGSHATIMTPWHLEKGPTHGDKALSKVRSFSGRCSSDVVSASVGIKKR